MSYLSIFTTFFTLGLSAFRDRETLVRKIENQVVDCRRWMSSEELTRLVDVAESCPGVFAVNISALTGYRLCRVRGAAAATAGVILPLLLVIILFAVLFRCFQDNKAVAAMLRGVRPAMVALIALPTFDMARKAKISLTNCWIPIASALLIWLLGVSPITVIIIAAAGGYVWGRYVKPTE